MGGGATTAPDETLRPWRRASGLLAVVQMPAMVAAIVLVFTGADSTYVWAFVAAAGVVLLDITQWALARFALRRVPDSVPDELYSSLALDRRDRRLVSLFLLLAPAAPVLLLAAMPETSYFKDHLGVAAILLVAAEAPSFLSLLRVWRHNSWVAISRIPAHPNRSHPRYRGPSEV
jgi:hypothetical protein